MSNRHHQRQDSQSYDAAFGEQSSQKEEEPSKNINFTSFPLGQSDFAKLVTSEYQFIDKTLLIKEIIESSQKVIMINRPRRWGKSLNLNMLYRFFNREVDSMGLPLTPQPHRVLFQGGDIKNELGSIVTTCPLLIAKDFSWQNKYSKYQGLFPTMLISWKDVKARSFQQFYKLIQHQISKLYQQHMYLQRIMQKSKDSQDKYQAKIFNDLVQGKASRVDLQNSLQFLSQNLRKYHKKGVYVLIDEYDAPLNFILQQGVDETERKQITLMISSMLSRVLKDNSQNMIKGILTGLLDTLIKQAGSALNNVSIFGIGNKAYSLYYGFSKQQICKQLISPMLPEPNEHLTQQILRIISQWYNGFMVMHSKTQLFVPYAVVKYLQKCKDESRVAEGESFWARTGSDSFLKQIFSAGYQNNIIHKILALANPQKRSISSDSLQQNLLFDKNVGLEGFNFKSNSYEAHLTYLLYHTGYITGQILQSKTFQGIHLLKAKLPNKDIQTVFNTVFRKWFYENVEINFSAINVQNAKEICEKMNEILKKKFKDIGTKNEKFFNSLFAMVYFFSENQTHCVSLQAYSGEGYIDTIFFPRRNLSDSVIIHEYKYTKRPQLQKNLYKDALWQLYEKNYMKMALFGAKNQKHIQNIIIRPIIIVYDESTQDISLYIEEDIVYTLKEAQEISNLFQSKHVKQILKTSNKNRNKDICRNLLLENHNVADLQGLLQQIRSGLNPTNFNYDKVLISLPHLLKCKRTDSQQPQRAQVKRIAQIIREKIPDSISLFYSSLNSIAQIIEDQVMSNQFYQALEQKKRDPQYFRLQKSCQNSCQQKEESLLSLVRKISNYCQASNRKICKNKTSSLEMIATQDIYINYQFTHYHHQPYHPSVSGNPFLTSPKDLPFKNVRLIARQQTSQLKRGQGLGPFVPLVFLQ